MMRFRIRPVATIVGISLILAVTAVGFGPWAAVCAVAASATVFLASALAYQEFYGDPWTALRYHWSALVGTVRGFHKIEDGTTTLPKDAKGPVLGPRLIIVAPYNAVVLERGSQQTGIQGPGIFRTRAFEFVKRIYDLRPRQRAMQFGDVLTKDGLLTSVAVSATYSIGVSRAAKVGQRKMTAADRAILQEIDLRTPDWEDGVRSAIERSVRDAFRARDLADLMSLPNLDDLADLVLEQARQRVLKQGVYLDQLRVESVQPASEVTGANTELWVAGVERVTQLRRAESLADWVDHMASALQIAKDKGLTQEAIYKEAWCRAIERMSKSIPEGLLLEPEVERALITLRRSAGLAP